MSTTKPCPFCGRSRVEVVEGSYKYRKAECMKCGACAGEVRMLDRDDAEEHAEAEALKRWNKRALLEETVDAN